MSVVDYTKVCHLFPYLVPYLVPYIFQICTRGDVWNIRDGDNRTQSDENYMIMVFHLATYLALHYSPKSVHQM